VVFRFAKPEDAEAFAELRWAALATLKISGDRARFSGRPRRAEGQLTKAEFDGRNFEMM
jgi:hypothetical protein